MEIGKIVKYRNQGRYEILEKANPTTRTMFKIKDIDRGSGWCEIKKDYIGVNIGTGWYRGQNNDYGIILEVHKKDLEYEN